MLATKQAMLTLVPTRSGKPAWKQEGLATGLVYSLTRRHLRKGRGLQSNSRHQGLLPLKLWRSSLGTKLLLRGNQHC